MDWTVSKPKFPSLYITHQTSINKCGPPLRTPCQFSQVYCNNFGCLFMLDNQDLTKKEWSIQFCRVVFCFENVETCEELKYSVRGSRKVSCFSFFFFFRFLVFVFLACQHSWNGHAKWRTFGICPNNVDKINKLIKICEFHTNRV